MSETPHGDRPAPVVRLDTPVLAEQAHGERFRAAAAADAREGEDG